MTNYQCSIRLELIYMSCLVAPMFYYYYAKADIILMDISKNSSISIKLYSSIIPLINGYIEDRQK